MNDAIQADYDQIGAAAARFSQSAATIDDLYGQVRRAAEDLLQEGWKGRGSDAFASEMSAILLPALQRLKQALEAAQKTTLDSGKLLRDAETEAAALFAGTGQIGTGGSGGRAPSGGPSGGSAEAPGAAAESEGEADGGTREGKFTFRELELGKDKSENPRELGFRYGLIEGSAWSKKAESSVSVGPIHEVTSVKGSLGSYDAGIEAGFGKHGLTVGAYGEVYSATVQSESVIGNKTFGLTRDDEIRGPGAEATLGLRDGTLGASIGFSAVTVKEQVGANVAGVNVGLSAEVGLKAEFGFKIGKKTEVKLPFVTLGIGFGGAKDGKE